MSAPVVSAPVSESKLSAGQFVMNVLNATAVGIVVALIPNAVLGELFKALLPYGAIFATLAAVVANIQWLVSAIIGFLTGLQFKFNPMKSAIISAACFIGSGALSLQEKGLYKVGLGDLINVMLVAALAAGVTLLLGNRLGSLTVILQPIIVGAGVGFVGLMMLPFVSRITSAIGAAVNSFTTLQPLISCILICMSFAVIIISPVSTVAIAVGIGITGLASGAANAGVASTATVLVVGSWLVNKAGITAALGLGGMKMMIPNLVRHPVMLLPVLLNAVITGCSVALLGIRGIPQSAGFGYAGLVGPIRAYSEYMNAGSSAGAAILCVLLAYFIIPFASAVLIQVICTKVLKIYKTDIYKIDFA